MKFISPPSRPWKSLAADVVLAGLVSGPIAAPFLAASQLPILTNIADIIYTMGLFVCPQPEMSLMVWHHWLMAVCMRCYGTVLALVFSRWLWSRATGREWYWWGRYGFKGAGIAVVLMLFYPLEWAVQQWGVWGYSNWVVFPFGWIAGLGLGLWIAPALYPRATVRIRSPRPATPTPPFPNSAVPPVAIANDLRAKT